MMTEAIVIVHKHWNDHKKTYDRIGFKWYGLPSLPLYIAREFDKNIIQEFPRGWQLRRCGYDHKLMAYVYKRARWS